ncbi:tetratricopeptide repeat protein [Cesiribacter sp. SM1]|uniref:tetratricopeptide repeat-containing sensor histidine kinase n=1 Tax=Cesiribacter sp. SM1 TaxID=2861196 RepID=UPI001CD5278F|nr:tetratricopeptide repeat protein [Cesiribacter sp. SM1]
MNRKHRKDLKTKSALFIQHTTEAINIADSLKDTQSLAKLYMILGGYQQSLSNFEEALDNYFKLLALYEALPTGQRDELKTGEVLNNIGIAYKRQGDADKALEYYHKALKLATGSKNELLGKLYSNVGAIHRMKNEYDLALEYYQKSIQAHLDAGKEQLAIVPLQNTGILYGFMGNYGKSLEYLHRALDARKDTTDVEGICYNLLNLGDTYNRDKQYEKALHYLNTALAKSRQHGYKLLTSETLFTLSETYAAKGEHKKAHALLKQHITYKDSLVNEESAAKTAEMEAKYNFAAQQREIVLLKAEQDLKEAELKEKKLLAYALTAGIVFAFALLFLIYRQFIQKKRTNIILEQYNEEIKEKNHHLEEVNARLQISEKELRQLNNTKDKFFSILSHDLRSPMNSLAGLLGLISTNADKLSKEELVQLTTKLNGSVKNLTNLLNNLLQWSMAQTGNLHCKPEKFALSQLVEENAALVKLAADAKSIAVNAQAEKGLEVIADRNMLDFVMRNLLSNAVKFTPGGGTITVLAEAREDKAIITVRDTGIGIPEENLIRLFKVGEHLTTEGTAKENGTGLGLILCKEFVELNSGTITVVSNVGEYTSFIVTVPAVSKKAAVPVALEV